MKNFHLNQRLENVETWNKSILFFCFILIFLSLSFWNFSHAQNSVIVNSEQNNIPIKEVTLMVDRDGPNQQTIVQANEGLPNPLPEDVKVEIESILLENGERIFVTNRFPSVKSANPGLGTELTPNTVRVIQYNHTGPNEFISHSNLSQFLEAIQEVVSTPDIRSYWDIGNTPIFSENKAFVDIIYPNQIPQSGYLMISERNGNSSMDLLPLDKDGELIEGATRVELRAQYDWNTGVNHQSDWPNQKQWLSVFRPELFGTEEPIYGFRVFDIGESDGKIIFFAREISAAPDNAGPIFGFFGGNNVVNIFENDELDGKVLDPSEINLTVFDIENAISNGFLIVDLDPNSPNFGSVSVKPGTPAGIYTFEYEIEDKLDGKKDRAVVTIRVVDPVSSDFPDCRDKDFECTSEDLVFEKVYLSDAFGNPIQGLQPSCDLGESQEVYLALSFFSNSVETLYEARFFADLNLGNSSLPVNSFLGKIEPSQEAQVRILTESFLWNCGDALRLNDLLITWLSEEPDPNVIIDNCEPYEPQNSQCLSELLVSTPLSPNDIEIVKTASKETFDTLGEEITYTISVTNLGTDTMFDLVVTDPLTGLEEKIESLEPGYENTVVFTTSYIITQEDLDNGQVINRALVTTGDLSRNATETITSIQNPSIELVKTADKTSISAADEEIVFTITVINTGNVTLNDVVIVDEMVNLNQTVGTLAPGESQSISVTYVVTQADIDKGSIVNVASITGKNPKSEDTSGEDTVTVDVVKDTDLEVVKTAAIDEYTQIGQEVIYTITVTNTGNVTLSNILIKDPLTGFETQVDDLAPGVSVSFETIYTVGIEDLDRGTIVNNVIVSATDPDGEEVNGGDSITITGGANKIIANDDIYGEFDFNFTGLLGNILDNDLLEGERPDPSDVDFEFIDLDGIIGLEISENGELNLSIPGVNEAREYTLRYVLREKLNPTNSDDAIVTFRLLNNNVDLSVTKTSNNMEVFEGDEFEYVITLSNIGGTDATDVEVIDELPNGVSYISFSWVSTNNQVELFPTIQGNRLRWGIPLLPADAVVTITLRVKADALTGENPLTISNIVTVVSSEDEVNPSDNSSTDVNTIQPFFIPNTITPNGDGRNDTFEIKGLGKFTSNEIVILNRYGDTVFQRRNYNNDWDAPGQGAGTYYYVLTGVDSQGKTHDFKGWIQVIR